MPFQMEESSSKLDRLNHFLHPPMLDTMLPSLSSYALKVPCQQIKLTQTYIHILIKEEGKPCRNTRFLVLQYKMKILTLKLKVLVNKMKFPYNRNT
jgi:hypothetical protein